MIKVDIWRFCLRIPTVPEATATAAIAKLSKSEQRAAKAGPPSRPLPCDAGGPSSGARPIFISIDLSRVKIMAGAVSHDACVKPETVMFTRQEYETEMRCPSHERWEKARPASASIATTAVAALASWSLGHRNANADARQEYLAMLK